MLNKKQSGTCLQLSVIQRTSSDVRLMHGSYLHFLPYLPALPGLAAQSAASSGDLLDQHHRLTSKQRLINIQSLMALNNRLELENEILELELRLKNARSRLREAHEPSTNEDSTDLEFTDSMLSSSIYGQESPRMNSLSDFYS